MGNHFSLTCDCCGNEVFGRHITHNLREMAIKAMGEKDILWYPNEMRGKDMIETLTKGLEDLIDKPEYYKQFNPKNNYGSYEELVEFVTETLEMCKKYPNTKAKASI